MIRRIELINFMSHEHTIIEPSEGLTVLVGPNNCGKSAVVTALQILAHNGNSTYVMRHGAKETKIAVHTDDGHEIVWRRTRSGSPSYTVDGTLFDRLGKGGVPDDVRTALRLPTVTAGSESNTLEFDLHFGEQKNPVFLIDKPGSQAAQFFASSSDAEKLVRMQALHKDRVKTANRRKSEAEAEIASLEETIRILEPAAGIEERVGQAEALYAEIAEEAQAIRDADRLAAELDRTNAAVRGATARRTALDTLEAPPDLVNTAPLSFLIEETTATSTRLDRARSVAEATGGLEDPPTTEDLAPLERLLDRLGRQIDATATAARRASSVRSLREPPTFADAEAVEDLLARLEAEDRRVAAARRNAALLGELIVPPAESETGPLQTLIDQLSTATRDLATLARAEAAAANAAEQAAADLRSWADTNPTCPTCGGPIDPNTLLLSAEAGGHRHGG